MTREEFKESLLGTKVATNGKAIELQKTLFALGFIWNTGETDIMTADCPYMFISDRFRITWTWDYDTFCHDISKEITADYILNTITDECEK